VSDHPRTTTGNHAVTSGKSGVSRETSASAASLSERWQCQQGQAQSRD
jgi:hypothetical protein